MSAFDLRPLIADARFVLDRELNAWYGSVARRSGVTADELNDRREVSRRRIAQLSAADPRWDFEELDVLPPGVIDPRVFDQDTYWRDRFGRTFVIADPGSLDDSGLVALWNHLDHGWSHHQHPHLPSWWTRYRDIHPGWREPPGWPTRTPLWVGVNAEVKRRGVTLS